ncbi:MULTISPECIES: hypothetical protein [Aliidiomarina]|nr:MULTISPECIES: hypothetical protein [Aliidiomarina]
MLINAAVTVLSAIIVSLLTVMAGILFLSIEVAGHAFAQPGN